MKNISSIIKFALVALFIFFHSSGLTQTNNLLRVQTERFKLNSFHIYYNFYSPVFYQNNLFSSSGNYNIGTPLMYSNTSGMYFMKPIPLKNYYDLNLFFDYNPLNPYGATNFCNFLFMASASYLLQSITRNCSSGR